MTATATALRRGRVGPCFSALLAIGAVLCCAHVAFAQDRDPEGGQSLLQEVATRVACDPTTYAPTVVVYTARQLDWSSSQKLFALGYLEANPRYTISGLPNDTPVGYAVGNRRVAGETVGVLGRSLANNAVSALVERALIKKAPRHRRLIRTLGWIERTAFASYWTYRLSGPRFEQWRTNERLAKELGAP